MVSRVKHAGSNVVTVAVWARLKMRGMSSYAGIAQERRRACSLRPGLRAPELRVRVEKNTEGPTGSGAVVEGLHSFSGTNKDWLLTRAKASKSGVLNILLNRWDPNLTGAGWDGAVP